MKKVLLISTLCFLFFSCTKTYEGMTRATIKDYNGLDGCGMLIVLENNEVIEPTNLAEFSSNLTISDGQKIWVKYHKTEAMSICMVGSVVHVYELEKR